MSFPARRLAPLLAALVLVGAGALATAAAPASAEAPAGPSPSVSPSVAPSAMPTASAAPPPSKTRATQPPKRAAVRPTIRGLVWDDRNRNGIQESGEPGIKGVGLMVTGPSFPGMALDATRRAAAVRKLRSLQPGQVAAFDPDIDLAQTDATGHYVFENRSTGRNVLEVFGLTGGATPAFWRVSPPGQGGDRTIDSDFTEHFNQYDDPPRYYGTTEIVLADGDNSRLDAGLYAVPAPKKDVTVSGTAWNDRNRNGLQDPGEPGIAGLPVNVANYAGPFVSAEPVRTALAPQAVTDANGRYRFTGLYPGTVWIYLGSGPEEPKPVWTFTAKGVGADRSRDSDVAPSTQQPEQYWGYSDRIEVKAAGHVDLDAGLYRDEPSPTASPTPTSSPVPTATASPNPGGTGGSLPTTGVALGGFLAAGLVLIGGGAALSVLARRRRSIG